MIRVLHICNGISSKTGGGIKSFLIDTINSEYRHHQNIVVLFSNYEEDFNYLGLKEGTEVYRFNVKPFKGRSSLSWRQLYTLIKSVDVIHQHSMWRLPSIVSTLSSKLLLKKVLFQPHGALVGNALKKGNIVKNIYYTLIEKYNIRYSKSIILNSELEKKEFLKFVGVKNESIIDKIECIPLGVHEDFILKQEVNISDLYKKFKEEKIITFISRLHPGKGIELLLESFREIALRDSSIQLKIGGRGEYDYEVYLKKKVSDLGLESQVTFLGFLDNEDKKDLLMKSLVFVLPSSNESFSISIAEALSRGVPVITSSFTPWTCIHLSCGLISDLSVVELRNSIEFFTSKISIEEYATYCDSAIDLVVKNYVFEKNMERLFELYTSC